MFEPLTGPITHIASIDDRTGAGVLGPSTGTTIIALVFEPASITPDGIRVVVRSALASGAIDNAGVADALLARLNAAASAQAGGRGSVLHRQLP